MAIFKGAGVAMVTPMKDNGEIDYEVLGQLIEDQIAGHTDAIIICGTTGEAPTLEDDEHLEAIRYTVDKTAGRIPVIAGTGSNNTAHAVMMSKEAQKLGADGCLLVAPYYNKATQNGLVRHFAAIAGAVDIPCILYNVPSRTGSNILPETALRLANEVENIVGIKEASGNIGQVGKLAAICEGKLDIYSGNDDQIVPICALGGIGVISVLSNVAPRETHNMVEYCMMNRYDKARQLQHKALDLVNALFCEVNPIPVKAALRMQGFEVGNPRLPLTEMEPEHKEVLRKAMIEFGCL
ncbi:MAG: 4-hydroxy-tetrahydrodipicolinate synthase [Lachnospiraceae bacterium]|jgi:4-hydroxy-tetrahydrodipicolinate synthase|nr:4-hydroxy-tetrahydrodipicolinate synthase [Lachnospiraceae bacterium]